MELLQAKHEAADALDPGDQPEASEGHFIVCGLGRFGLRIVELLRRRGVPVTVITDAATREDRKHSAQSWGARIVEGDFRFLEVLHEAGVERARTILFVASTEAENLEAALDVRRIAPHVRIVMRLESDKLAERLRRDFAIDAVLSPPVLAARAFAAAALDTPPAPRRPAPHGPVGRGVSLLPRRLSLEPNRPDARFVHTPLRRIAVSLILLFLAAVAFFQWALDLSLVDAIYFTSTIVTTVGFGDIHLREAPAPVKLFGSLLMFGGITLIAVLSSTLTNYFLSGSAAQWRTERTARSYRDHVIVCGLGSVGFEVAEDFIARGVRVVVVDETPGDVHWINLSSRLPLLVGDGTRPDVLLRAGIDRARAVIAATSDDAINLEIGLVAQSVAEELRPEHPLRIVLRCFDPDLSRRIHAVSDVYTLLSSAEISAPIFVSEALAEAR